MIMILILIENDIFIFIKDLLCQVNLIVFIIIKVGNFGLNVVFNLSFSCSVVCFRQIRLSLK
jgi:hypothetical protein